MDPRTWQRITSAIVLLALIWGISRWLRQDHPRAAERATLGGLVAAAAERFPILHRIWHALAPLRQRLPAWAADTGLVAGLAIVLGAWWIAAAILEDVYHDDAIVRVDSALTGALGAWRVPWGTRVAEWFSEATSPGGTFLVSIGVVGVLVWLKRRVEAIGLFAAVAGTGLWTTVVKVTLGRARPGGDALYDPLGDSFPSGHTSGTAALYLFLAWLLTRHDIAHRRIALFGAAGLTAIIGMCRLYLAVHWLSDVLAGAALGVGWAGACMLWTRNALRHQEERVARGVAQVDPAP